MEITSLQQKIRAAGGRMTKTRTAILEILLSAHPPISAAEIIKRLGEKRIRANRTTVYRELAFLTGLSISREVRFLGKPSLFEIADSHHHHLICTSCDTVESVDLGTHLAMQEKQIQKTKHFTILSHALEFYGLCKRCRHEV